MGNLGNVDFNQVSASFGGEREPLPKGEYQLVVEGSEIKMTKAGNGSYAGFTMQVVDGPHQGRKVWLNCNLTNPSEKAEQIGRAELKGLAAACGVTGTLSDTSQLHGRMFRGLVDQETGRDGKVRNRIVKCLTGKGLAPTTPATTTPQLAAQNSFGDDDIPF